MKSHITINIKDNNTELIYVIDGEKAHSHVYDYGYNTGADRLLFLEGIMYMLETINDLDHVPHTFRLNLTDDTADNPMRHKVYWYKALLENYNYTQFDKNTNAKPYVIIDSDERYKKVNRLGLKI